MVTTAQRVLAPYQFFCARRDARGWLRAALRSVMGWTSGVSPGFADTV